MTAAPGDLSVTIDAEYLDERIRSVAPYEWWRRFAPLWLDVTLHADGSVTFTPNGWLPCGRRKEPGTLAYRSMLHWIADTPAFLNGATGSAQ